MRIAVEGCSHGCLDQIYSSILSLDKKVGKRTSLLILCGDVQTVRNQSDLHCIAMPDKYKAMGDFHRYYNGQRKAPILTLMIGGNHEASNYLWELYHGGWVAPNMYYLGAAGCVNVGGIRIAGISGIYKSHDYSLGRFEQMPYNHSTVRSIYHTRQYDTYRLSLLSKMPSSSKPDIVVSHDWPNTIEQFGDVKWLKKKKPFFVDEINSSSLGSPPLWSLLQQLRPLYWFSAHLHVRFAALVKHWGEGTRVTSASTHIEPDIASVPASTKNGSVDESVDVANAEEMTIDMSDEEAAEKSATNPEAIAIDDDDDLDEDPMHSHTTVEEKQPSAMSMDADQTSTRFLALSKCLEGQDFLQILDIPAPFDTDKSFQKRTVVDAEYDKDQDNAEPTFQFDLDWLAITRATHAYLSLDKRQRLLPSMDEILPMVKEEAKWLQERIASLEDEAALHIEKAQSFVQTAPASTAEGQSNRPPSWYTNPQTIALCSLLGIDNRINPPPPLPLFTAPQNGNTVTAPNEEEEIRKIEEAAEQAMKRQKVDQKGHEMEDPVTLFDEDEGAARWKEGAG